MKFILICRAFFQRIWETFKRKVLEFKSHASLLAYAYTAICIKIGEDFLENDEPWEKNTPTIYDLDTIVRKMNDNIDSINKKFHLSVDIWSRQIVKHYMNVFNRYHDALSKVNGRELTLVETYAKITALHEMTWFQLFTSVFLNDVKNIIMAKN